MPHRISMALKLVSAAETDLEQLTDRYQASLRGKSIDDGLKVRVKRILENLRSALDYCAHSLCSSFCTCGASGARVYFPIADKSARPTDFPSVVGKKILGLPKAAPSIVTLLSTFQAFHSSDNDWLPDLATLCNENKHEQLTPQTRTEIESIVVESGTGTVSWNPKAVRFEAGVSICGVPVDPGTQMPVPSNTQSVKREVWVDFQFADTGISVLPFLRTCVAGVRDIVQRIDRELSK